jgi:hypothetical protein
MNSDMRIYSFVGYLRVISNSPTIKHDIKGAIKSYISHRILRSLEQAAQLSVSCMRIFVRRIGLGFNRQQNGSVCSPLTVSIHRLRVCRSCSSVE